MSKVTTKISLQSVIVCIYVELLEEPVQQDSPLGLAVVGGSLLKAVGGVVASYPQHISHGVPDLRGAVELQRVVFTEQGRSVVHVEGREGGRGGEGREVGEGR